MKTRKVLLSLLVLTSLFLVHCGQDTIGDMAAREQNRERVRASLPDKQNKMITGIYQGKTKTSDIFLILAPTKLSTGGVVPTSSLAGSLIIAPQIDTSNERFVNSYPFSSGQFDPLGGDSKSPGGKLTIPLESDGPQSNLTCGADLKHNLSCDWYSNYPEHLEFVPSNEKAMSILTSQTKSNFIYSGENDKSTFLLEFESNSVPRDNSRVPFPTIAGRINQVYKNGGAPAPSTFKNGSYDIHTGAISVTLDDNTGGNLSCKILKSGQSLKCTWHTTVKQEFLVYRTPIK